MLRKCCLFCLHIGLCPEGSKRKVLHGGAGGENTAYTLFKFMYKMLELLSNVMRVCQFNVGY